VPRKLNGLPRSEGSVDLLLLRHALLLKLSDFVAVMVFIRRDRPELLDHLLHSAIGFSNPNNRSLFLKFLVSRCNTEEGFKGFFEPLALHDQVDEAVFQKYSDVWKFSGSFCLMVCSMTRLPQSPPARQVPRYSNRQPWHNSPPRPGGGVGEDGKVGMFFSLSLAMPAQVLAICMRDSMPSCMRAPPEAEK